MRQSLSFRHNGRWTVARYAQQVWDVKVSHFDRKIIFRPA